MVSSLKERAKLVCFIKMFLGNVIAWNFFFVFPIKVNLEILFIPNNNDHMSRQSSIFHMQFFSKHDGLYHMMYIVWWTSSNPLIFSASNIPWNGHTLKFGCTMILALQKLAFFLTWLKHCARMQAEFAKSFSHFPTGMQMFWSMVVQNHPLKLSYLSS